MDQLLNELDSLPHGQFAPDNPPDKLARLAALDPEGSFAVAAPAGSGKTGLLTQRLLTLLARSDQPEEVLAITFTRKAAGEMQERIMAALRSAADTPEPADPHQQRTWLLAQDVLEQDRRQQWQLLMSPQRLRIQTIDSLCRAITRQLPLESQLGAQPDTLEAPALAYRQAVHQFLARLESDESVREDLKRLLRHLDSNLSGVEALLIRLLAKRDQWLGPILGARQQGARVYLEAVLNEVIEEQLTLVTEHLGYHVSELCTLADRASQNVREEYPDSPIAGLSGITGLPEPSSQAMPQWSGLAELLLTSGGEFRKRLTKKEGFPAGKAGAELKAQCMELIALLQEEVPDLAEQLQAVRELPPAEYTENQWQLLDSLTRLLPLLSAELTLVFKHLGATDYSAIAQAASLALGDEDSPSDIALKLDYRIRHILVDEFQDTASPQLELLQKLTAGWQPGDGRTLFIVGDGMQSCYGFRDANVGLFLDARRHGIGQVAMEALDLQVNFRSQTEIVRWTNRVFQSAFPARDEISRGAVSYAPSIAFNEPLEGDAVRCHGCLYQNDSDQANTDAQNPDASPDRTLAQLQEAETVADLAQQALAENADGSVAILVRGRPHLKWILPALSRRQLHWQATEIDRLANRMAIVDLLSLTRALLNPDDRIAWLSVLRAPWCGLDLHDLHKLVTADLGELSPHLKNGWPVIWQQLQHWHQIEGLSDAGSACLARLMKVLEPAWRERQRKPLRQWLEGIWRALGGPALLADPGDQQDIPSYFALLERHQQGGALRDWEEFRSAVDRLFAAPRPDADPRLQVMTLHKSKGLEFDTVIIPGLDRGGNNDDKELLLWQQRLNSQGEPQLLLGPLAPTGQDADSLYKFMRTEAKIRDSFEATRLLYVGCTRAIKRLHLLACIGLDPRSGKVRQPRQGSLMHTIWPEIQEQLQTPSAPAPIKPPMAEPLEGERPGLQHILRLPPNWQAPEPEAVTLLQAYRGREYDDLENIPETEPRPARLARHSGTVLHSQLQRLTEERCQSWNSDWAARQKPFWALQLRQLGWHGKELESGLAKIEQGLRNTLSDPEGLWVINPEHSDSRCEWALRHSDGKGVVESVIDRSFIDQGVRWLIDYKSSRPEAGQSLETFLQQEIKTYLAQLARYTRALQAFGDNRIQAALYFPLLEQGPRLYKVSA